MKTIHAVNTATWQSSEETQTNKLTTVTRWVRRDLGLTTLFFIIVTFTFRPPLCYKLELYDAPNSPIARLKVSYYHRCFYGQKLRMTE